MFALAQTDSKHRKISLIECPRVHDDDGCAPMTEHPHTPYRAGLAKHPLIRSFPCSSSVHTRTPLCAQPSSTEACAFAQHLQRLGNIGHAADVYANMLAAIITLRCILVRQPKQLHSLRYCVG